MRKTTSYQRRTGRLGSNQKSQLLKNKFLLRAGIATAIKDQTKRFSRAHVEIGFGMGEHLLKNASTNPDILFIGIDIYKPGIAYVLTEIDNQEIKNCYLVEGDAVDVIVELEGIGFHHIDIAHPDPWPKKRHKKRQLISKEFLKTLIGALHNGGKVHIVTDDFPYFEAILAASKEIETKGITVSIERGRAPNSKYGRKAKSEGREINGIEIVKYHATTERTESSISMT